MGRVGFGPSCPAPSPIRLGQNVWPDLGPNYLKALGPNKHRLVTYIQVNVYTGNMLSWLIGG